MKIPETEPELQRLIQEAVEESTVLEYKAAGSLDKREPDRNLEITKDVSAIANAGGGILIYGIAEHKTDKHKPGSLSPILRSDISKETLEHIISGIRPKLSVRIIPVPIGSTGTQVAYVVEIPKGDTAHQAKDLKYYQRRNFEVLPMEDYQIRDVMGRAKTAEFEIQAEIKQFALQQGGVSRCQSSLLRPLRN